MDGGTAFGPLDAKKYFEAVALAWGEGAMGLDKMTVEEQEIIRDCLKATCSGPFLEEFEFQTRMGVDRDTVAALLKCRPTVDASQDTSVIALAINNSLNELCYGLEFFTT